MAYNPAKYTQDPDYQEGMDCFLKCDYDGAMEHFTCAADNGNPEAEFRIAKLYYYGRGAVKLAEAMEREGVTLEDVAATIGSRPATVARWMDGEGRGFNLGQAAQIQAALFPRMTLEQLFA